VIIPPVSGEPIASPWGIAVSNLLNSPPRCLLSRAAGQSFANGTGSLILVTFGAADVVENTHGFFDDATDSIKIPVGMAGLYQVHWYIEFAQNGTGARRYGMRLNGSNYQHQFDGTTTGSSPQGGGNSVIMRLAEANYLQVVGAQSSGAALLTSKVLLQALRIGE